MTASLGTNDLQINLKNAIRELYSVFAKYPVNPEMSYCTHCYSHEEIAKLLTIQPFLLTAKELYNYASDAIHLVGEVTDLKYFLPRLLELVAFEKSLPWSMEEAILSQLERAEWEDWPNDEQKALENYLFALWEFILSEYPSRTCNPYDFIQGRWGKLNFSKPKPDIIPFLQIWIEPLTPEKLRHLATFINQDKLNFIPAMRSWLAQDSVQVLLENAFFEDHTFEQLYSDALQYLAYLECI